MTIETLALCKHGIPAKFMCALCNESEQIRSLNDFKARQIDENRKISRRVDDIEQRLNEGYHPDLLYEKIKFLERKVERMESNEMKYWNGANELDERLSVLEFDYIDTFQKQIDELENRVTMIEGKIIKK